MLAAEGVVAGYGAAEQILKGASVRVEPGEIVTIIGPNGAGKSTLLKTIAGLIAAKAGQITLAGKDVTSADAGGRAKAGIAFVPQERNVFGSLTVAENLEIAGFLDPAWASARAEGSMPPIRCLRPSAGDGPDPLWRPAADPRHGHGPDEQSVPDALGRADRRACRPRRPMTSSTPLSRSTATGSPS